MSHNIENVFLNDETNEQAENCYSGHTALPDSPAVAMAYVPFQRSRMTFDAATALCKGTLFPVLNKPFIGGSCR